ncbi:PTR2-domain-containing protein [Martensiomyces pterosporus]|nr:PTR2-domain-containing protein [Martensiomyces pterosporus]
MTFVEDGKAAIQISSDRDTANGSPLALAPDSGSDLVLKEPAPRYSEAKDADDDSKGSEVFEKSGLRHKSTEDYLRENERWATEEDMNTLRHNYIQNGYKVPNSNPGAINGGQQMATGLGNFFQFWCYITPILGAIIADQWWGKFKTILVFSFIYMIGDLILTLTSIPASIRHNGALPGLIIAMITIGLGTGGIKSNVSPMVAEQYGRYRPFVRKLKNGMEVVVDRELTIQSIFNWFYWSVNIGSLSAVAPTELEHNVDFWAAYLLPTLMFALCIVIFWIGRKNLVVSPPTGSIMFKAYKAIKAGVKNSRVARKQGQEIVKDDGKKANWMEYAKPSYSMDTAGMDWDDKFVDELMTSIRACKIFLCFPVFWLCYGQMSNNMVSQSGQMNTGSVPNDIMQNIDPLFMIILIPIFDKLVFPGFRRCGMELRPILRISIGFLVAAIAMAYAAIVQHLVYSTGPFYDHAGEKNTGHNNISAAIQIPGYIFIAISELFANVTGLEYAYTKAPDSMKSIVMSLYLFTNCGGSILAFCFNPIAKNPKLVENFAIVSGLMGAVCFLFYFCFRHYDKQDKEAIIKNTELEEN